ncbi:MAG TPA: hypothetical protein VHW01_09065, partial [Polyangiaceae bacterium]|nr:hypothetical protein [Polyangiaceae bacterium]
MVETPARRARAQLGAWLQAARGALRAPGGTARCLAFAGAAALLLATLFKILGPMLADFHTYGFHDWDVESAYRYITVVSIKQYHEGPWWHPWLCGGFPAFGDTETASNFLSPYLPLYLLTDLRVAIRLEVIGGALTSLVGTFLLARRFTKSAALCAAVAALYVLNGRWALQAAAGHTWHLQYGLLPWALFFYDRALEPGRLRNAVGTGVALGCMVLWGGIYPLPQSALIFSVYALLLAISTRSTRPLLALAIAGGVAIGFGAPKLFAVIDHMGRVPRLIESREVIGLADLLVMFTAPDQHFGVRPVRTPAYNWHEWGIYIGPLGVAVLCVAVIFARGQRGQPLKITALLLLLLGFGAFHENAPWALLHQLPPYSSQHVPSRWHYPMLLLLGLAFLTVVGPYVDRWLKRAPALDLALLLPLALFCTDIGRVARQPFEQAFWLEKPDVIPALPLFEHHTNGPVNYVRRDWAPPMLLSMMANTGVIKCYGVDTNFKPAATAADAPGYRGRAYIEDGAGTADISEWSPNHAVVRVAGAGAGSLVVYNMNYDPSWRANGEPALEYKGLVATRLKGDVAQVTFRYFPRTLRFSIPLFLLTLGLVVFSARGAS